MYYAKKIYFKKITVYIGVDWRLYRGNCVGAYCNNIELTY
ncbi:hypothetical protein Mefer_1216 [Methanocaldococcus fervens AG86]|uniref:Uncharacterized protein n=1 Tax=Methanocaldococcus fervens (strain DSM 4213 / JCM 15782 / AG86) TaxID=573064 RepID=C7P8Z3_METFA|nr:hypothetical protein Mefer_1216 [Methanocaldococcus fervens AG86]